MNAQACYPGDPYPYYPYHPYGTAGYPWPTYGTTTVITTPPLTDERIREILREELQKALKELKP
jgi:hypothetical protein